MRKHLWTICFTAFLILFTLYISLDTFVLTEVYDGDATAMNTSMFADETEQYQEIIDETDEMTRSFDYSDEQTQSEQTQSEQTQPEQTQPEQTQPEQTQPEQTQPEQTHSEQTPSVSTGASEPCSDSGTYTDENISIVLSEYEYSGTAVYVADVTLSSASYLRTAFANDSYGKNITAATSSIAKANNAVLAINGDYYGAQKSGYVIRNGVVYRSSAKGADVLCIYADGTMEVVSDRDYTADELVSKGVWQAFSFGPGLIEEGMIAVSENDEVGRAKASNPRTAIGLIEANHFVFVVSDGRTEESEGLSLYELAVFMQSLGVKEAYNLDGGGSSTMYFNGQVVNNPTSGGRIKEREVSDIVYIGG